MHHLPINILECFDEKSPQQLRNANSAIAVAMLQENNQAVSS